jgi:hypothetical protein
LFLAGHPDVPSALRASQVERFQPVSGLRKIQRFDGSCTARLPACNGLVLQCLDELDVCLSFLGWYHACPSFHEGLDTIIPRRAFGGRMDSR